LLKTGLSAMLSRFVAAAPLTALPADAIDASKRAFIDTVGVMLAGRLEPAVAIMKSYLPEGNEAYALFGERRLSARDAALLNGVAGHVLDFDDVALHGHPSVVLVPAILAEAQRLNASGMDALKAYVIGFEVWTELGSREPDAYHLRSWHPTAVLGTMAATGAVAALNRLREHETRFVWRKPVSVAQPMPLKVRMACCTGSRLAITSTPKHPRDWSKRAGGCRNWV
jgi:2-methylcitrate dehydratase PrpD